MKHLLLFFILSFSFGTMAKAEKLPFIENGKTWYLRFYSPKAFMMQTYHEGPTDEYALHFGKNEVWKMDGKVDEDTLIAGQAYKKLYRGYGVEMSVAALLREEGERVYQWNVKAEKEELLYDFALNQGDVFLLPCEGNSFTCTVTEVDEYEVAGRRLKRIHFDAQVSNEDEEGNNGDVSKNVWVEGLGAFNKNPLNNVIDPTSVGGGSSYCPYIFTSTDFYPFSFAQQGFRGQELVLYEEVTETGSNGANQKNLLQYELLKRNEDKTDTLHVFGYLWSNADCYHYIYCYDALYGKVFLEQVEIGMAAGPQKAYRIDVKFPMFFGDYYHYVVEDDEGSHPVGGLVNSDNAISEEIGVGKNTQKGIYDLTGRPVSAPTKGIYIQNGKKVLVK